MSESEWRQSPDGAWWFRGPDNRWHPSDIGPAQRPASSTRSPSTVGISSSLPAGAWLAIIAGTLAAIGSLLPWVHFTTGLVSIDRNGWQLGAHDGFSVSGPVVMLLGVVTVVIGIGKLTQSSIPRYMQSSPIVTGIAIAYFPLKDLSSIHNLIRSVQSQDSYALGSVGVGLWLTVAGGAVAIVSGLILRSETANTAATENAEDPPYPSVPDFDADQMLRCEACGSTNQPNRNACWSCQAPLLTPEAPNA